MSIQNQNNKELAFRLGELLGPVIREYTNPGGHPPVSPSNQPVVEEPGIPDPNQEVDDQRDQEDAEISEYFESAGYGEDVEQLTDEQRTGLFEDFRKRPGDTIKDKIEHSRGGIERFSVRPGIQLKSRL